MSSPPPQKLDGPVDFESDDTPSISDGIVQVHVDIDGTLTVFTNYQGFAATTHGMLTAQSMTTLRGDIAAVDQATTQTFECDHFPCSLTNQPFETLSLSASGQQLDFTVDRDVDPSALPSELVKLLDDLSNLPQQAH